jgi:hypothetical protein
MRTSNLSQLFEFAIINLAHYTSISDKEMLYLGASAFPINLFLIPSRRKSKLIYQPTVKTNKEVRNYIIAVCG